jgi:uncharacterized protein (DUF2267 family)
VGNKTSQNDRDIFIRVLRVDFGRKFVMEEYEQAVFISYAWGGESEGIVNQIDEALQQRGLKIIRDKKDLGYKGSISAFMERIGQGNSVIVVINDKYLRSPNCMFELVEIAEGKQFHDRIFPLVLEDADIYDPVKRLEYVKYWEIKRAELAQAMREVDPANLQGIRDDMDLYDRIRDEISGLTSTLKDMNTLTPDMHRDTNFTQLYDAITRRMQEASATETDKPSPNEERKPMDPVTLATAVTTLLTPFISKISEKAIDKIAEQLPEKVGAVWNGLWNRMKEKPAAADAANDLITNVEDPDYQQIFTAQLKKLLEKDEGFASQLTDLVKEAKSDPSINIGGDGVVADNNSIAVGKVSIGGNVNGNFVIGNNNQVNNQ